MQNNFTHILAVAQFYHPSAKELLTFGIGSLQTLLILALCLVLEIHLVRWMLRCLFVLYYVLI